MQIFKNFTDCDWRRQRIYRLLFAAFSGLMLISLLSSCRSSANPPQVSKEAYKTYRVDLEQEKQIVERACVVIDGQDIQLPMTSGNFRPQETRTYSLYVWAYDPGSTNALYELWQSGRFQIDVMGTKASISIPTYTTNINLPASVIAAMGANAALYASNVPSHNVLEIKVNSGDLDRPFTIVAWFPKEYTDYARTNGGAFFSTNYLMTNRYGIPQVYSASKNPWGQRLNVKVYNGDLRTHVEMIDQKQAEASFGKTFPKYFSIGRVYLRNRQTDKNLVVYTTSLRANVLLYHPPTKPDEVATDDSKSVRNGNYKAQPIMLDDLIGNQLALSDEDKKTLRNRIEYDRLGQEISSSNHLSAVERSELVAAALENFPRFLNSRNPAWQELAATIASSVLHSKTEDVTNSTIANIVSFWREIKKVADNLAAEAESRETGARKLIANEIDAISKSPSYPKDDQKKNGIAAERAYATQQETIAGLRRLLINGPDLDQIYAGLTNQICMSCLSASEYRRWTTNTAIAYADLRLAQRNHALADALASGAPVESLSAPKNGALAGLDAEYQSLIGKIADNAFGVLPGGGLGNPFDTRRDIHVNPGDRALAFSEDSDREVALNRIGYLWHESMRPMTFQAVLNSLMVSDQNSWRAVSVQILQSAATVAGGLVGMGAFIKEFQSEGYITTVGVVSTIFVPEYGKLIMEDLNKHIRNLGDMGLDTVVVLPPNGVRDGYIFFPKGPIYNYVDEFDVKTPAYIKHIDNDDISVEATLIDSGVQISAGPTAQTLTGRALNEGKADQDENVAKIAAMQDSLRAFDLKNATTQIQALFSEVGTNGVGSPQHLTAAKQACEIVQKFQQKYGADLSGPLVTLLTQNQAHCDASPPLIQANSIPTVDVLAGLLSKAYRLPVIEADGAPLSISVTSSATNLIPANNVSVKPLGTGAATAWQFTVLANTNVSPNKMAIVQLTFGITNSNNLGANVMIPVNVHGQAITRLVVGATMTSNQVVLGEDQNAFVSSSSLVYDSDPQEVSKITFSVSSSDTNSTGWVITTSSAPTNSTISGIPALEAKYIVDASNVTNSAITLRETFSYQTNAQYQADVIFWKGGP